METEIVPNTFPSLFAGYAVIWAVLVVYIVYLGRRLSRLETDVKQPDRD
jgi:CcmD family protein